MAKFKRIAWLLAYFQRNKSFEFEWDQWNKIKSQIKHGISPSMIESVFSDGERLCLGIQVEHNFTEDRFGIVGKDYEGNVLFVCFTFRKGKIRAISCRRASRKERRDYEF